MDGQRIAWRLGEAYWVPSGVLCVAAALLSYGLSPSSQAFVMRRQAVTAAEAEAWLQEFDALEQQGTYVFGLTPILTEAVKA